MDKERLRIPSDSSSGSSSRDGTSPGLSFRNNNSVFSIATTHLGPPPNSPANFTPILPSQPPFNNQPPPGFSVPRYGDMYQFPPSYQNPINYSMGMPGSVSPNQTHILPQPQPQYAPNGLQGQYEMNGYHHVPPVTSPPPGYDYYGPIPTQSGAMNHSQQPVGHLPQHGMHNQPGDSNDLETRLNLLLNSASNTERYDGFGHADFISSQSSSPYPNEMIGMSGHGMGHENRDGKPVNSLGGLKNPIIENFAGSMSMCNGTYTHFGPSTGQANRMVPEPSDLFGDFALPGRQPEGMGNNMRPMFVNSFTPISSEQVDIGRQENILDSTTRVVSNPNPIRKQVVQTTDKLVGEKLVNHVSLPEEQSKENRAASPGESLDSTSRPQTPGKPSYLEVLTKAGGGKAQVNGTTTRKASSTSSSPVQSAFSSNSDSVPNLCHRKSVDYFIGATASSPASSCPSASSSPATKPKTMMSGIFMKGKENVSSPTGAFHVKQSGLSKNSPSNSPSHNVSTSQTKPKPQDRKILTSQNVASAGGKTGKVVKNGKVPCEKPEGVEDLNGNEEVEIGWQTFTNRGRNNNSSSFCNKNSQKRTSTGSSGSEATNGSAEISENYDEDVDVRKSSGSEESVLERKANSTGFTSSSSVSVSHSRKLREKEKPRNRKEGRNWRNCIARRLETLVYIWLTHMISAVTWLWSLVTDVASLSLSLGVSLLADFYTWTKTKAVPNFTDKVVRWKREVWQTIREWWSKWKGKISSMFSRGGQPSSKGDDNSAKGTPRGEEHMVSFMGPDRNIMLPANGDEALKRLLSEKGKDPYSILGVRSDSSDETIRRYYKRQAVLVHPDKNLIVGAEEAFKILARAFELVGDPVKRAEYHQKVREAQAKEKFCGELGNLLEQLRKKMEAASSTIRCTKCNSRHKKGLTDRPLFAARYCSQCRIHHAAREGELWAERGGWFGLTWNYFACMDAHIWEINEWARCQKTNLKHIKADAHCVMYRLVAGGNNHQNHHNQPCHGAGPGFDDVAGSEADEWDSLINNLYKSPPGSAYGKTTGVPGKTGCCTSNGTSNASSSNGQAAGKRRKGKRK